MTEERKLWGKYLGISRDHYDPEMLGRLRLEIPSVYGIGEENWSPWALPCLPPGRFEIPVEGEAVWVEFLDGDPSKPVWVGWLPRGTGDTSTIPDRSKVFCVPPEDEDDPEPCEDCKEQPDGPNTTKADRYYDHLKFHDHKTGKWMCPRIAKYVLKETESGHSISYSDKEGAEYIEVEDKNGNRVRADNEGLTLTTPNGNKVELRNIIEEEDLEAAPAEEEEEIKSKILVEEAGGAKVELFPLEDASPTPGGPATIVLSPGIGGAVAVNGNFVVAGVPYAPTPLFVPYSLPAVEEEET